MLFKPKDFQLWLFQPDFIPGNFVDCSFPDAAKGSQASEYYGILSVGTASGRFFQRAAAREPHDDQKTPIHFSSLSTIMDP